MDEPLDQVTFGTARLYPFDVDAPTLTTADGVVYVPMRWLCELLGLAPSHWIGTLCAYYRDYGNSKRAEPPAIRQLPHQRPDATTRLEWSLEWSNVMRWLSFRLQERYVPPSPRRDQLEAYRDRLFAAVTAKYDADQVRFRDTKRVVIDMLQDVARRLEMLDNMERVVTPHLDHGEHTASEAQAIRAEFAALIEEGRRFHRALAEALREALNEMLSVPVMDGLEVDAQGNVVETQSIPVLPQIPDMSSIRALSDVTLTWLKSDLVSWLRAHGIDATIKETDSASGNASDTWN